MISEKNNSSRELTHKNVFVSGGTSGLGIAIVRSFVTAGYQVAFQYNKNTAEAAALSAQTGARPYQIDFLRDWTPPEIEIDIFVHNAGVNLSGESFDKMSEQELYDTMQVNVLAASRLARQFYPHMKSIKWGRIISINSIYGFRAGKRRLSYNISKFGLSAFTQSLAIELAEDGVTVNEICPGPINTSMLLRMAKLAVHQARYPDVASYMADVSATVPIGRMITPDEISVAVLFLASEAAAACTGASIVIDGGMSLRW